VLSGSVQRRAVRLGILTDVWFDRQAVSILEMRMRLPVSDMQLPRAWLWLIVVGLVALSGSAMVVSVGVLLLALTALVVPMFAITVYSALRSTVAGAAMSREAALADSTMRPRRPFESSSVDVYAWENEGGAQG
jgi:hypothetical protein